MKADRDLTMVIGANAPALGDEERSDEVSKAEVPPARPVPDPEGIAKPTRHRFTAEYRLRIVEEADRCAEPGEVGRLLRREGLYSSHLSAWRKARRRDAMQSLTPRKRGANPASVQVRQLEAKVARLEKELATARTILDIRGKSFRAGGVEPQRREQLLMSASSLATKVGIAPACGRWGCPGQRSTAVKGLFSEPEERKDSCPGAESKGKAGKPLICSSMHDSSAPVSICYTYLPSLHSEGMAADRGPFSICYTHQDRLNGVRLAADRGPFSICYTSPAPTPARR